MEYQSNALWPRGVCSSPYGDNISTDKHQSEAAADAVCNALKQEGFGGQRQDFPLMTWVSPVEQPPMPPKNEAVYEAVGESIRNATYNGIEFEGWTYREIADDMVSLCQPLEDWDPQIVEMEIRRWFATDKSQGYKPVFC
ncbi:hypothetical protein HBA55_35045 [Pseudomaricurvus alkylphenolicus]|uniref:hypothetical protein n=1 Tax=Pseudomaricurvus alkylphenolicus TaxID=1306991 RepID=UPI0014212873|nr:hypothetical protein [Pseudomaricurvus alkylphenolicus]NIB44851.1 hypothetical protein [Pseudomaricurvus alkylphenolicus]